jgi:predicted lactoylglutathione lyase
MVTLGVADLATSREFYERMGWTCTRPMDDVCFFQAGGMVLSLWSRDQLAADSVMDDDGGWGGVTLAHNVHVAQDVDRVLEQARDAGATIGREPAATFWGGYSGVFIDPDGHPWEVAYNPHFPLDDDGLLVLPPADDADSIIR